MSSRKLDVGNEPHRTIDQTIESLEDDIVTRTQVVLADGVEMKKGLRYSTHFEGMLDTVERLIKLYRQHGDFAKEMHLYNSQQTLLAPSDDEREATRWELYKGSCCKHYERESDMMHYLEKGFRMSQEGLRKYRWLLIFEASPHPQKPWSMYDMPYYGKDLCDLYTKAQRHDDAIAVASTCYTYVREQMIDNIPIGAAFEPAFENWMHWTEICGNTYVAGGQEYMAKHVYSTTIIDFKRFHWDSAFTETTTRTRNFWTRLLKRKLDRLSSESDEESEDDEDREAVIPLQRRLKLTTVKPTNHDNTQIECTTSVVDIAKAPPYKALSYAWGSSRKLVSYTNENGPPYTDNDHRSIRDPPQETVLLDENVTPVRQTVYQALRKLRSHETPVVLWIDVFGVAPDDMKRRATWALRMRDIYKYAEEVMIWLGEGDEDIHQAIDFINYFWDDRPKHDFDFDGHIFNRNVAVPWECVEKLFSLEWWTRIWTIQEFVVARSLFVRYGNKILPWRNLLEFTTFVDLESHRVPVEREVVLRPIVGLVQRIHACINLREEYRIQFGFPLEELWQLTKKHESYDPRDKIFALLGMLDQPSAKYAPPMNYDFCACAVYSEMMIFRGMRESLDDRAKAMSERSGLMMLLGYEQGTDDTLKHVYMWDTERINSTCDGEVCGRRLKCFSDKVPEIPLRWGIEQAFKHMKMCYEMYVEMKAMVDLTEAWASKVRIEENEV